MQTGTSNGDPRFSTANASLLSPVSQAGSDQRQSYFKTPISPTATEVDGTMGNPGVPAEGHGISQQMHPGGSPSAAEIDGRMGMGGHGLGGGDIPQGPPQSNGGMRASMSQPYAEGPYELGHEGR